MQAIIIFILGIIATVIFTFVFLSIEEDTARIPLLILTLLLGGQSVFFFFKGQKDRAKKLKQYEIAEKDERNIAIRGKVWGVVANTQTFLIGLLAIIFVILEVRTNMNFETALWTLVGLMVAGGISMFAANVYYNKKM